jgi:16S rRNA (adenine1518-N6/adenine1519-N6)-dimethyltransferase
MYQNLLKPTHLQELCKQSGLTPSKKYGQNYLITESPIKKMIEAAGVEKEDTVVEIGPGFGVLTFALAEKVQKVIAFEIEKKLQSYWDKVSPDNLKVVWGNVLNHVEDESERLEDYKVVANLPYQITSNVLRALLELENKAESITVMVQKEVADRIVAKPGAMSILAVSVQYYGESKIVTKVAKGSFWPAPKVDSAVLHIVIKEGGTNNKEFDNKFFEVVRAGFANKRKQLWRNLSVGLKLEGQSMKDALKEVVGNEKVRAEELSIEQWVKITNCIIA